MSLSPGSIARRVLGPLFPLVARLYRRVFVNLDEVASCFPKLPPGSLVLDVGGGDGAVIDRLLTVQPDLRVVMVDIASRIGSMIDPSRRYKVKCLPSTSVLQFNSTAHDRVDMAIISDVMHHVPPHARATLIREVLETFGERPVCLVIKDIEPVGWRAALSVFCDKHISGDHSVCLISQSQLIQTVLAVDPSLKFSHTTLADRDHPNYAVVFGTTPGDPTRD